MAQMECTPYSAVFYALLTFLFSGMHYALFQNGNSWSNPSEKAEGLLH